MQTYLNIAQILISIVLVILILSQTRGTGFTGASQDQTTIFRTRRGLEKTLFQVTLVLATVFVLVSIASVTVASRL